MKGFSKYNSEGLVTSSENQEVVLGLRRKVRHFYNYDNNQRRIYYKKAYINDNGLLETLIEETTRYENNNIVKTTADFLENKVIIKSYNNMDRLLYIKTIDMYTGEYTEKKYNSYKSTYDISKGVELFVPYGKVL